VRAAEHLMRIRYRYLVWYDPRSDGTHHGSQMADRIRCAEGSAGDADNADHLAFELVMAAKIDGILERTGKTVMVIGGCNDNTGGFLYHAAESMDFFRIGRSVVTGIAERKRVF